MKFRMTFEYTKKTTFENKKDLYVRGVTNDWDPNPDIYNSRVIAGEEAVPHRLIFIVSILLEMSDVFSSENKYFLNNV